MPVATGTAALIAAGIGAGASIYGANKQSKDQKSADATNRAAIEKQNQDAWQGYLLQRGISAPGTPTGVLPANGTPTNTRLPLWANMSFTEPGQPAAAGTSMVRRRAQ